MKTLKKGNTEYYQGISIKENAKKGKWTGRKNRKWFMSGSSKKELIIGIDSRIKNIKLSELMDKKSYL